MNKFDGFNITELLILQDSMSFNLAVTNSNLEKDEKQISPTIFDNMLKDIRAKIKEKLTKN
ncbi:hypothetical protein N9948_02035 [bacterium]|nr:hypothetical protein [bacterium]